MATIASATEEMVHEASQCSLNEMEVSAARDVYRAAVFIQSEFKSLKNNIPIPPSPTDLLETTIQVPHARFL